MKTFHSKKDLNLKFPINWLLRSYSLDCIHYYSIESSDYHQFDLDHFESVVVYDVDELNYSLNLDDNYD